MLLSLKIRERMTQAARTKWSQADVKTVDDWVADPIIRTVWKEMRALSRVQSQRTLEAWGVPVSMCPDVYARLLTVGRFNV